MIGKTALYRAAKKYHRDIVDLLVSSGSVMDQEIQDGNIVYSNRLSIINLFLYLKFHNYSKIIIRENHI